MMTDKHQRKPIEIELDGYKGRAEWIPEDQLYYGKVTNLATTAERNDEISFQGQNKDQLIQDLRGQLDFYRSVCLKDGKNPLPPMGN